MATLFGVLTQNDHQANFVATQGQEIVLEVAQTWIANRVAEFNATMAVFIETDTEIHKQRYLNPGSGFMQETTQQSKAGTQKASGSWDVAYPLRNWEIAIGWNDVDIAYMSAAVLSNHIVTGMTAFTNTKRDRTLRRLFNNVQESWTDDIFGSLNVEPLANQDGTLYPPLNGIAATDAQENHYLGSGYIAANIDDDNNPLVTIHDDIVHHFGGETTGGENLAVFCNKAQKTQLQGLENFVAVPDNFVITGDNSDVPSNLPTAPGKILGRSDGVWVIQYDFIPANYLLGIHLERPAPLKMRHDTAASNLGTGDLMLVATDERHPFTTSYWRARFGIGAGNRLNGVAMFLSASASYTIPDDYD